MELTVPQAAEEPVGGEVTTDQRAAAEEQAALRRVAELVARGADRQAVLEAVVAEAFRLFPVGFTALLTYDVDGAASIVALHHGPPGLAIGERAPHVPDGLVLRVHRSHAPTRVDAYSTLPGAGVARMKELGITAGAAAPILVDGRLWGVLAAMTHTGTVAPGLEHLLARFAELAATAVAGAQAKDELGRLADEQSALRRIAELAVKGAELDDVLHAVATEAATLLPGAVMTLGQFTSTGSVTVRASSGPQSSAAAGLEDDLANLVRRTGQPSRLDADPAAHQAVDQAGAAAPGVGGGVAVPISLQGQLWGLIAATSLVTPLPADAGKRLSEFADIAAAATSSALARADLRRLADEQAALREVAEIAARDAPADEVLHAVAVQASRLAGVEFTTVLRYEADGATEIVALSGGPRTLSIGARAPGSGTGAIQRVWSTHRSARVADLRSVTGQWPELMVRYGYSTTTAVPILIQGELWGTLIALGRGEPLSEAIGQGLSSFAELASIAIAGAQARGEVAALADEQAALHRVAALVAHGTALSEVFSAVTLEVSKLLGNVPASLHRLDPEEVSTTVAASGGEPGPGAEGAVVVAAVLVAGRAWGRLTVTCRGRDVPARTEERLQQFAELAAVAITNDDNKSQLVASRARVVATADETRHRLQRDVHDGAQQRLVHTIITLKLARDVAAEGTPAGDRIREALHHAELANRELRDLVRGILPASLTRGGLRGGVETLVSDLRVPVHLSFTAPRLSQQIETTAYFIVAEALTNVIKHSGARQARVTIELEGAHLVIVVTDDGVGGADPSTGSGLTGLSDRVGAAAGTLTITSPVGHGTALRVCLPVPAEGGSPDP